MNEWRFVSAHYLWNAHRSQQTEAQGPNIQKVRLFQRPNLPDPPGAGSKPYKVGTAMQTFCSLRHELVTFNCRYWSAFRILVSSSEISPGSLLASFLAEWQRNLDSPGCGMLFFGYCILNHAISFLSHSLCALRSIFHIYLPALLDEEITSLYVGRLCSKSVLHPAPPWLFMQSCLGA